MLLVQVCVAAANALYLLPALPLASMSGKIACIDDQTVGYDTNKYRSCQYE